MCEWVRFVHGVGRSCGGILNDLYMRLSVYVLYQSGGIHGNGTTPSVSLSCLVTLMNLTRCDVAAGLDRRTDNEEVSWPKAWISVWCSQ